MRTTVFTDNFLIIPNLAKFLMEPLSPFASTSQPSDSSAEDARATEEGGKARKDNQCTISTSISEAGAPTPRKAMDERFAQGSGRNVADTATSGQTSEDHTGIGVVA
ncbi:MAG: hypothetical protein Q9192_007903, partial [Flavoplaca navasiana]